jgi:hypothetical protein
MSFATDDLGRIANAVEVEIETQAPDGPVHRTIIWIVVDGDDAFIRSYRGPTARWYREAQANPAVALHVTGRRLAATAIPATDPESIELASAALRRKYAADPGLRGMVAAENLPTTLRIEPT